MKKLFTLLTLLVFIGGGKLWGTSYIPTTCKKILQTTNLVVASATSGGSAEVNAAITDGWCVIASSGWGSKTVETDTDFGTSGSSSAYCLQVKTDGSVFNKNKRVIHFLVTNITGVKALGEKNTTKGFQIGATEYIDGTTDENTTMNVVAGNVAETYLNPVSYTTLDPTKTYIISIFASKTDNFLYGVRFITKNLKDATPISSTVTAAAINTTALSASDLTTLNSNGSVTVSGGVGSAPTMSFTVRSTATYSDESTTYVDETKEVTATDNTTTWDASATFYGNTFTIKTGKVSVVSTEYSIEAVKVNGVALSDADLTTLNAAGNTVTIGKSFFFAPKVAFTKKTVTTYSDSSVNTERETETVDGVVDGDNFKATVTLNAVNYVVKTGTTDASSFKYADYRLTTGQTFKAGDVVSAMQGTSEMAQLTVGVSGGNDFKAAVAEGSIAGYTAMTPGNEQNGTESSGTVYYIKTAVAGKVEIGVALNSGRNFYIKEDGTSLSGFDGITVDTKYTGTYTFDVKSGSTYTIYCTGSKLGFYGFSYYDPSATITITPAKTYTTYVTPCALDFTGLDLKAYVATAATTASVTLDEVTTVPAGTPLVLKKGSAASYDVPVIASASAPGTNLLKAGDGTTSIGGGGKYDYILKDGKFYHASAGTVAVGKAYLHLDDVPADPPAPVLNFVFGDVTGIADVRSKMEDVRGDFFDLQGRKVAQPTKGLYIVNGKKIVIK